MGCLHEKKAVDIKTLEVTKATILADYFIIASVDSTRQARAAMESIRYQLKQRGAHAIGTEGGPDSLWVLLDYATVVIHIFQHDARVFYDLDNYWGECPEVELEPISPIEAA